MPNIGVQCQPMRDQGLSERSDDSPNAASVRRVEHRQHDFGRILAQIREEFTPEKWAAMTQEQRRQKFQGRGLAAVATFLGIRTDPLKNRRAHWMLGRAIFECDCLRVYRESIAASVKRMYGPAQWAAMTAERKRESSFQDIGLNKMASIFGVHGNPVSNHSVHLALGRTVFGCDCLKAQQAYFARELRTRWSAASWAGMTRREKAATKIDGFALQSIATIFGVEGNPCNSLPAHLALGTAIYGRDCSEVRRRFISDRIRRRFALAEWNDMTAARKRRLKVEGLGMKALATSFGVKGDPVNLHAAHLLLGRTIWNDHGSDGKDDGARALSAESPPRP